jgi:hypothetical protein
LWGISLSTDIAVEDTLFRTLGQTSALRQESNFENKPDVYFAERVLVRVVMLVGLIEPGGITRALLFFVCVTYIFAKELCQIPGS